MTSEESGKLQRRSLLRVGSRKKVRKRAIFHILRRRKRMQGFFKGCAAEPITVRN